MRPIVFIVLIFSAPINSVFAQSINGRINYEVKLMEDNLYYPGTLYFNKDTSVFQYKNHIEKRWFRNEGIGKIQSEDTDSIGRLAIRVINSNYPQYIIRDFCGSDVKIYIDTVEMKWVLSNEQKMIGEYLCKKATTRFRGRDYIAWYCPEIAVSFGPLKYNGLDGLILEISTMDKKLNIYATSIILTRNQSVKVPLLSGKVVTRKEFNLCQDDSWVKGYYRNKANIAKLQKEFPDIEITDSPFEPRSQSATEIEQ
jgi:GLPGLI family protein